METFDRNKSVPFADYLANNVLPILMHAGVDVRVFSEGISSRMRESWLAWQEQRVVENPANAATLMLSGLPSSEQIPPTGFEAYLLGSNSRAGIPLELPHQVIEEVADIGVGVLDSLALGHRYDNYLRLLDNTLIGDRPTLEGLYSADVLHGATLAKMRARLLSSPHAKLYRDATHNVVDPLAGELKYVGTTEEYKLPVCRREAVLAKPPVVINWRDLTSRQVKGMNLMANLGKMGDPFLRRVLNIAREELG